MRVRTISAEVEATQFTRKMAEGSEKLPAGVHLLRRETKDGKFPEYMKAHWPRYEGFHKHVLTTGRGDVRIEIGDWIIEDENGRHLCPESDFDLTYEPI